MQLIATKIAGCYEIQPKIFDDNRGMFIKTYHQEIFAANGLNTTWHEEYFSISHKNVIRGMHFQLPPHNHEKLVYCPLGAAMDVVVDLRKYSPTFKQYINVNLTGDKCNMLYIPKGCAHGFKAVADNTIMMYKVATVYTAEADSGIAWDSCDINWQLEAEPIISLRDKGFIKLNEFNTPFDY